MKNILMFLAMMAGLGALGLASSKRMRGQTIWREAGRTLLYLASVLLIVLCVIIGAYF